MWALQVRKENSNESWDYAKTMEFEGNPIYCIYDSEVYAKQQMNVQSSEKGLEFRIVQVSILFRSDQQC